MPEKRNEGNAFLLDAEELKKKGAGQPVKSIEFVLGKKESIQHELPEAGAFKQYKNLEDIAKFIADELVSDDVFNEDDITKAPYTQIIKEGRGFFMSHEQGQTHTGLLSLCPAVLTAVKIWQKMPESPVRTKLLGAIKSSVNAIFKIIYRDGTLSGDNVVFDASPYESDAFTPGYEGRSYMDSISWAVPVFLRILHLTEIKKDSKERKETFVFDAGIRKKAKDLAKWCIKYVNNSVVWGTAKGGERPVGWSYTRLSKPVGAGASLYFTYAASTVYLSFFATYDDLIAALRLLDKASKGDEESYVGPLIKKISEQYWDDKKELENALKVLDEKLKTGDSDYDEEFIGQVHKATRTLLDVKNADRLEALMFFNDNKRITNESKESDEKAIAEIGQIGRLKWNLLNISADIWDKVKDKLEDKFLYDDFKATVAEPDAIENGGQTNALFTGLLQIGIMINSAYDVVIENTRGAKAYQQMQDAMILHIQKTQRYFDKLEDKGKAFGVDSFVLRFSYDINEETDKRADTLSDKELAVLLRKKNIRVCSLTPLLLKTNNIMSEFVIAYPQKQMSTSLARISEKRFQDRKGKYRWFWETDGYHAISNYYYVAAIFDFYDYYKKYEFRYVERYDKIKDDLLRDLGFAASVRDYYQELANEKASVIKEKDNEIAQAKAEVTSLKAENKELADKMGVGDELVKNINKVMQVSEYFESPAFYKRLIGGLRNEFAKEAAGRYKDKEAKEVILEKLRKPVAPNGNGVFDLFQALLADAVLQSAVAAGRKSGNPYVQPDEVGTGMDNIHASEFVLKGGEQLVGNSLIGKVFAEMFSKFNWKN